MSIGMPDQLRKHVDIIGLVMGAGAILISVLFGLWLSSMEAHFNAFREQQLSIIQEGKARDVRITTIDKSTSDRLVRIETKLDLLLQQKDRAR